MRDRTFADVWATGRNNFDALRLLLAVSVIAGHSFPLAGGPAVPEPFGIQKHHVGLGGFGVWGFFAISGLLITNSWLNRPNLYQFFRNRVLRLVPGYVACMFVCEYLVAPLSERQTIRAAWVSPGQPHTSVAVAQHLAGVARRGLTLGSPASLGFSRNPYPWLLDGSLWTIRYEFLCYVAVAACGVAGLLRRPWVAVGAMAVGYAAFLASVDAGVPMDWGHRLTAVLGTASEWAFVSVYFAAGVVMRLYLGRIPHSPVLAAAAAAAIALSFATFWATDVVLPVAGVYLMFYLALQPAGRLYRFGRFGDFSYGTYMYAWPIQQLLALYRPGIGIAAMFATATPAAVLAGAASWYAVERHFIRLKHHRGTVATTSAAAAGPAA